MVICSKCKKETSLWNSFSENEKSYCKECWNKKEGKSNERDSGDEIKKINLSPELKRIEELKSTKNEGIGLSIFGIILIAINFFSGHDGFFPISFEFILGVILCIVGGNRQYNAEEKIKDLKLQLEKQEHKKGKR